MTLTANWLTFLAAFALTGAGGARMLFARLDASDAGSGAWTDCGTRTLAGTTGGDWGLPAPP